MTKTLGVLAIVFGIAGVLLACPASIGVWWSAAGVADRTDKLTDRAKQGLDRIEKALGRMEEKVKATSKAVEKARRLAEGISAGTAKDDPAQTAKIDNLLATLVPLLEQSDALAQAIRSVVGLLESAAELSGPIARNPARREQLRSTAQTLSQAAAAIEAIRDNVSAMQRGEAVPTAQKLADLAARGQPPLNRLAGGLAEARQQAEPMREELEDLRRNVQFWAVTGPVLLTLFLIWFGLGQLALVNWGRRQFATRTGTA